MVARTTFRLPNYIPNSIKTLILLNSPQTSPPILLDKQVANFYHDTNNFWQTNIKNDTLSEVLVISIGGGIRDTLVRSELTEISSLIPPSNGLSILSTSIPEVHVSTDHDCIVWCNQLVKMLAHSIYDIIDPKTRQDTLPLESKMNVFRKKFLKYIFFFQI